MFNGQVAKEECPELLGPLRYDRRFVPKRQYGITILRWLKSQKSADSIYIAVEAWNQKSY